MVAAEDVYARVSRNPMAAPVEAREFAKEYNAGMRNCYRRAG
jgi:hypothetical protein